MNQKMRLLAWSTAVLLVPAGLVSSQAAGTNKTNILDGLPQGLVLIPEGEVQLGMNAENLAKLAGNELVRKLHLESTLLAFMGAQKPMVPTFLISAREVTNGEYEAFVKATRHRFPFHWWKQEDRRKHEKDFYEKNPTLQFVPHEYWEMSWEKLEWEIPKDRKTGKPCLDNPVEWVSYRDALAFCRWAGLRLPTEAEWVRAARSNKTNLYVWGDAWEDKKAWTASSSPMPADSSLGADVEWKVGQNAALLRHMAGNVYELTSSRFAALPGWDREYMALGRKKAEFTGVPRWDPRAVVVKGGSYQSAATAEIACLIDARDGADMTGAFQSLGFRTCKSLWPGLDAFRVAYDLDLQEGLLEGGGMELDDEENTNHLGIEAWEWADDRMAGYHSIGFAPIAEYNSFNSTKEIKDRSTEDPVPTGLFYTTEALEEPPVGPGFYMVYFRDDGPSQRVLQKIAELKEAKKKAKRQGDEEPQEPKKPDKKKPGQEEDEPTKPPEKELTEEDLDPNSVKLGDLRVSVKFRYFIFRTADEGKWVGKPVQADIDLATTASGFRSEMKLNRDREELLFRSPVRFKKSSSPALFCLNIKLPKGTLARHSWRFPNQKTKDIYGYKKGWLKPLFQSGIGQTGGEARLFLPVAGGVLPPFATVPVLGFPVAGSPFAARP